MTGQPNAVDLSTLRLIPTFGGFDDRELSAVAGVLGTLSPVRDEVIFEEGDPARSCIFVVDGAIGVYKNWGNPKQQRVALLGPGSMLGQVSLIDGGRRSATCKAEESRTYLYTLGREEFDQLYSAGRPFALRILRHVSLDLVTRVRSATERLREAHEDDRAWDMARARDTAQKASEALYG